MDENVKNQLFGDSCDEYLISRVILIGMELWLIIGFNLDFDNNLFKKNYVKDVHK